MPDHMAAQSGTLPAWLRRILAVMALVQAGFAVAATAFVPEGWTSLYGLPLASARVLAVGAAVLVAALAALAGVAPANGLLVGAYRRIESLRCHPASFSLPLLLLVPFIAYLPSAWAGHMLLAAQSAFAALALYLADPQARAGRAGRWAAVAAALVIGAGLGLRLWFMLAGNFGPDEGMTLNAAANMARGRGLTPELTDGPGLPRHRPDWGRAMLLYGLWARWFGMGVIPIRTLGLLFGLLALVPLFEVAWLWYGPRTALLTAGLGAVSYLGLLSVAGRNNALPMFAFGVTLLTHVYLCQRERAAPHFWVGLLAALSLETHLLALALITALAGTYLVRYLGGVRRGKGWLRADPLWFFALGLAPGLAAYIFMHFLTLSHPERLVDYLFGYSAPTGLGENLLAGFRIAGLRYTRLWAVSPAEMLLLAASAAAALVRRAPADRHWLALLAFNEVGYFLFGPTNVVNNDYTAYALPILLAGAGALFTHGLRREERAGPVWAHAGYAGVAAAVIAYSISDIRDNIGTYQQDDAIRRPLAEYVRAHIPPGETIMGIDYYYPYFTDYTYLFTPAPHTDSIIAPALAGMEHDAYWLEVLLDAWPRAMLESHFFPPSRRLDGDTLAGSYMAARHAEHPMDWLWVVPDDGLVTDSPYAAPNGAALQMVAHAPPGQVSPGQPFDWYTIWVARAGVGVDVRVAFTLADSQGRVYEVGQQLLVGGWSGTRTTAWQPSRFYDVTFALTPPVGLPPGAYRLRISLTPSGTDAPCAPQCEFEAGEVIVGG